MNKEDVTKRSEELLDEFAIFWADIAEKRPDISKSEIAESWLLQKVAGIQVVIQEHNKCLMALSDDLMKLRGMIK
jgi:hypothetical protein